MAKKKRGRPAPGRRIAPKKPLRGASPPTAGQAKRRPASPTLLYSASQRPSDWYTAIAMRASPENRVRSRRQVLRYLREAIQGVPAREGPGGRRLPGLREIYLGFGASDGYDLRHIKQWSLARVQHVQMLAKELNHLTATPFKLKTPQNKKQRQTLQYFTRQYEPTQKRYVVQVPSPNYGVRFREQQMELFRPEKFGGYGKLRFWMFADYLGKQAETREEFVEATKRMLPDMPDWGYFSLWGTYGPMGISQPKESLLFRLTTYFNEGESFSPEKMMTGLDEVLQGWVLQGDEEDSVRAEYARTARRQERSRWQKRQSRLRRQYSFTKKQRQQKEERELVYQIRKSQHRLKVLQRLKSLEKKRKRVEVKTRKKKRVTKKARAKK